MLGAPRELLAVGEVPAVERSEGPAAATAAAAAATAAATAGAEPSAGGVGSSGGGAGSPPASRRGCRLLAGQYFGEKGLLRQAEVGGGWVPIGGKVYRGSEVDLSRGQGALFFRGLELQ